MPRKGREKKQKGVTMGIKKLTKDEFKKSSMSNYMSYRSYTNSKDMMDHPKPENKRPKNQQNGTCCLS